MPFYEDLSPYRYSVDDVEGEVVNVGWLAAGHRFSEGEVPADFADRLSRLVVRCPVNRMRGWQACPFCDGEYPVRIDVDGELHAVGDAEIRVDGPGGRWYAAPTLVAHYVAAHRYLPPGEFIEAVLTDERAGAGD